MERTSAITGRQLAGVGPMIAKKGLAGRVHHKRTAAGSRSLGVTAPFVVSMILFQWRGGMAPLRSQL